MPPTWEAMLGSEPQREKMISEIESSIPMGKFGTPEDVTFAALFLASDESKYITGIELNVDGGILAGASGNYSKNES